MQHARFKVFLEHNPKPKYIIQNLDVFSLVKQVGLYDKEQFLPYLHDPLIRSATRGYEGEFGPVDYYFPLFKYNGHLEIAKLGLLNYFGSSIEQRTKYKGYQGKDLVWDFTFDKFKKENPSGVNILIDRQTENEFLEFLDYCKKNDIKVIFVFSPEYIEVQPFFTNRNEVMRHYQEIAKTYEIPFLDYSNHPICFNKAHFYNSQHLNKTGAEIFSNILAQDLLNLGLMPKF
jgi:hypothetical protein